LVEPVESTQAIPPPHGPVNIVFPASSMTRSAMAAGVEGTRPDYP